VGEDPEGKVSNPTKRVVALIGQIAALLIASFCALVSVWCLYDAAFVAHSANDWGDPAAFDVFLLWIVNIPGCVLSLALAFFIRPIRRSLLIPTLLLALACPLLLFLVPSSLRLNKARHQKETDELTRKMESHRP
jgi:hypothetical protein